jgi:hypothetical protein
MYGPTGLRRVIAAADLGQRSVPLGVLCIVSSWLAAFLLAFSLSKGWL